MDCPLQSKIVRAERSGLLLSGDMLELSSRGSIVDHVGRFQAARMASGSSGEPESEDLEFKLCNRQIESDSGLSYQVEHPSHADWNVGMTTEHGTKGFGRIPGWIALNDDLEVVHSDEGGDLSGATRAVSFSRDRIQSPCYARREDGKGFALLLQLLWRCRSRFLLRRVLITLIFTTVGHDPSQRCLRRIFKGSK